MTPKTLLLLLSFFCAHILYAQQRSYIYYFDGNLIITPKDRSVLFGKGVLEAGLLKLTVTDNLSSKIVVRASFTDTTLNTYHGLYQSFYLNGLKNEKGNYDKGMMTGVWMHWDTTGHIIDSTTYDRDHKLDSTKFYYYKTGVLMQQDFTDVVHNTKEVRSYTDSGRLASEVFFRGEKGIQKVYKKESVQTDSLFTRAEEEATFPGGDLAFNFLVQKAILKHEDELLDAGKSGTCSIRFIIDTDGNVTNVEPITMVGTKLAKVAVNAIRNSPKWKPAIQYGKKVKAYREQPVSFAISDK